MSEIDELKREHKGLQERLEQLRDERKIYEPTETTGSRQTQDGSRQETERIDNEMKRIRDRQREIFEDVQRRQKSS